MYIYTIDLTSYTQFTCVDAEYAEMFSKGIYGGRPFMRSAMLPDYGCWLYATSNLANDETANMMRTISPLYPWSAQQRAISGRQILTDPATFNLIICKMRC